MQVRSCAMLPNCYTWNLSTCTHIINLSICYIFAHVICKMTIILASLANTFLNLSRVLCCDCWFMLIQTWIFLNKIINHAVNKTKINEHFKTLIGLFSWETAKGVIIDRVLWGGRLWSNYWLTVCNFVLKQRLWILVALCKRDLGLTFNH